VRAEQILEELSVLQRQRSMLEARQIRLLAEYQQLRAANGKLAARSAAEEIALELHLGPGYAKAQVHLAEQLTERLPGTLKALAAGEVELAKARALVEITDELSLADARKVEEKVLPTADERTLTQVRASARYFRDRFDPDAAERRRVRVRERRSAEFRNHDDGEAQLSINGPGERIYLAFLVLDAFARQLRAAGDQRTLEELRHDIALDLLLGQGDRRVQVQAFLHVPATTLAGISEAPGILAGYGPVTAQVCRVLAAGDAVWHRVFCDPISGVVKDLDRKTYRPPASLARYVQARDGTCIAPGCMKPAEHCQLDHTIRWADEGCTCEDNLGPLCVRHHRLKDLCGWQLEQPEPGHFVWTSPMGQRFDRLPQAILQP
jgi:Domain of unknown function (DUF222)